MDSELRNKLQSIEDQLYTLTKLVKDLKAASSTEHKHIESVSRRSS